MAQVWTLVWGTKSRFSCASIQGPPAIDRVAKIRSTPWPKPGVPVCLSPNLFTSLQKRNWADHPHVWDAQAVCGMAAKVSGSIAHPPGESRAAHPLAAPQLPSCYRTWPTALLPHHQCKPFLQEQTLLSHRRKTRPFRRNRSVLTMSRVFTTNEL